MSTLDRPVRCFAQNLTPHPVSACFSLGNLQDGSNETPRRPGMQPENVSKSEKWPKEQDLKALGAVPASPTANLNLNAFELTFPIFDL